MDSLPSFQQRFGSGEKRRLDTDFPESARKGLLYLLQELVTRQYIPKGWPAIYTELARAARTDFQVIDDEVSPRMSAEILIKMHWASAYAACERIYKNLLGPVGRFEGFDSAEWVEAISIQEVRSFFSDELNNLLSEENIGFQFDNGYFQRPGRVQTQKNMNRVTAVLSDPRMSKVRVHYNKAHNFFKDMEHPDFQNSIKEAVCAMEAAAEVLSGSPVSQDFSKEIGKISGSAPGKIPTPIAQAMIKIFGYRGTGEGVTHGNLKGLSVTKPEAELVLSTVAAFITYLVDFYESLEPDIPF